MREQTITVIVMATAMWLSSCDKTSYKSYHCNCIQEKNGEIMDKREYGLQATDLGEAGVLCNDIEDRVNYPKDAEAVLPAYNCKATP